MPFATRRSAELKPLNPKAALNGPISPQESEPRTQKEAYAGGDFGRSTMRKLDCWGLVGHAPQCALDIVNGIPGSWLGVFGLRFADFVNVVSGSMAVGFWGILRLFGVQGLGV